MALSAHFQRKEREARQWWENFTLGTCPAPETAIVEHDGKPHIMARFNSWEQVTAIISIDPDAIQIKGEASGWRRYHAGRDWVERMTGPQSLDWTHPAPETRLELDTASHALATKATTRAPARVRATRQYRGTLRNVSRAIEGDQDVFTRRRRVHIERPIVRIGVGLSFSSATLSKTVAARMAAALAIADALAGTAEIELTGLLIGELIHNRDKYVCNEIPIKAAGEPWNPQRAAHMMRAGTCRMVHFVAVMYAATAAGYQSSMGAFYVCDIKTIPTAADFDIIIDNSITNTNEAAALVRRELARLGSTARTA